jgi:hypothetical protein
VVCAEIDREAQKGKSLPPDHAPLVIDLASSAVVRCRLDFGGFANCGALVEVALYLGDGTPTGRANTIEKDFRLLF